MGGNALSVPGVRLTAEQYAPVREFVETALASVLNGAAVVQPPMVAVIPSYANKPDFGDIDVLVSTQDDEGIDYVAVASALGSSQIVRNGEVTSFGLPVLGGCTTASGRPTAGGCTTAGGLFQVDLIQSREEAFDFALRYFSFNDLGNLLGRVAHKAGFKLGQYGLLYPLRDPLGNLIVELLVTHDWGRALSLLGYDPESYERGYNGGFRDLTDIFSFVLTSRYCNRNIYLLENRNATSRIRDRKRKTYSEFLEWLHHVPENAMPSFNWSDKDDARKEFLGRAFENFPEFFERYQEAVRQERMTARFKEKFNGILVGKVTGLTGKDLGLLMSFIRKSFINEGHLRQWVLLADEGEIRKMILGGQVLLDNKGKVRAMVLAGQKKWLATLDTVSACGCTTANGDVGENCVA